MENVNGKWLGHIKKLDQALLQYGIDLKDGNVEHSFASPLGYGGKIDWHNDEILIDFKTKAIVKDVKRLAYDENCWQLAAYNRGMWETLPTPIEGIRRCANVFIGVDDCEVRIVEWSPEDITKGWQAFKCLLDFWQITKNYTP